MLPALSACARTTMHCRSWDEMKFYGKRVLFLGAHPDDIELGCGALIHHVAKISQVTCVTLSDNQTNPDLKNVVQEQRRSMARSVFRQIASSMDLCDPRFPQARQEILQFFLGLGSNWIPMSFSSTRSMMCIKITSR